MSTHEPPIATVTAPPLEEEKKQPPPQPTVQQQLGNRTFTQWAMSGAATALDYANPRWYLPTWMLGYSEASMREYTNPDPVFGPNWPRALTPVFKRAFKIDPNAGPTAPADHLTAMEYQQTATFVSDVFHGVLALRLGDEVTDDPKAAIATMKDVIEVARTRTGRDLLTTVAAAALRVTIHPSMTFTTPRAYAANPMVPGAKPASVYYRPGALAGWWDPDVAQRVALKGKNPWLLPHRTDTTLYHELVHAFHYQGGTQKAHGAVVGQDTDAGTPVPPVDPTDAGVPLEEYATVGLGPYAGARFTENKYRAERRGLGEADVVHRPYYKEKP